MQTYGSYCFWSWLRYWYIDSVSLVMMTLLDKAYYDYDFEKVEKAPIVATYDETVKSDEEVNELLSMFGMGQKKPKKPETLEEIQEYIIKEETKHGS